MLRVMIVSAAAVGLVACSHGGSAGNNSSDAPAGAQARAEPDNTSEDQGNRLVPVQAPSPQPMAAIPASFQGRWASVSNECDPANAAIAKGLLVVAADKLSFYESRGTPSRIRRLGPDSLLLDLPMSGEGMTWTEPTRLTLEGNGRTLIRQATGSPDRAGVFVYQRCPA